MSTRVSRNPVLHCSGSLEGVEDPWVVPAIAGSTCMAGMGCIAWPYTGTWAWPQGGLGPVAKHFLKPKIFTTLTLSWGTKQSQNRGQLKSWQTSLILFSTLLWIQELVQDDFNFCISDLGLTLKRCSVGVQAIFQKLETKFFWCCHGSQCWSKNRVNKDWVRSIELTLVPVVTSTCRSRQGQA